VYLSFVSGLFFVIWSIYFVFYYVSKSSSDGRRS